MKGVGALKLTYSEVVCLFNLLAEALLHGVESRSRNQVVNILKERIVAFEKERMDLIKQHTEVDDKGNPKVSENGRIYIMKNDKQAEFNKKFQELVETSEFIFDILPSNEKDFKTIAPIILNSKKDFNYEQGVAYSTLCEKLENKGR